MATLLCHKVDTQPHFIWLLTHTRLRVGVCGCMCEKTQNLWICLHVFLAVYVCWLGSWAGGHNSVAQTHVQKKEWESQSDNLMNNICIFTTECALNVGAPSFLQFSHRSSKLTLVTSVISCNTPLKEHAVKNTALLLRLSAWSQKTMFVKKTHKKTDRLYVADLKCLMLLYYQIWMKWWDVKEI